MHTTSTTALAASPSRHIIKRGLPWPPPPPESHLRAGWRISPLLLMVGFILLSTTATIWAGTVLHLPIRTVSFVLAAAAAGAVILGGRRYTRLQADAVQKLSAGDHAAAAQAFDGLARRSGGQKLLRGVAIHNLGLAEQRRGNLLRAVSLHGVVAQMGLSGPMAALTPFSIATGYALLGDVDAADAWLGEGERLAAGAKVPAEALARAVVALRRGRAADVVALYEARWRALEASDSALGMRANKVVLALALRSLGREDEALANVRTAYSPVPGQLDWLGAEWPEMRAFLVEHRL